jgi:AI-2 transport protein TqsA
MDIKIEKINSVGLSIAVFIIIIAGLIYAEAIVNPLLMALFISIICAQPIEWLKKKKVPGGLAVLIVILAILGFYAGFIELISSSLSLFISDAPKYYQRMNEIRDAARETLNSRGIDAVIFGDSSAVDPSKIMQYTTSIIGQLREMIQQELTFIFLTIFLLTEVESIGVKVKVVDKYSIVSREYLNSIGKSIRHYLSIKTVTSLVTGLLVSICLAFIGVDYPILWGFVAYLLNYIPTIGSIIAAVPAVILSILELGFPASLLTLGVYVMVNIVIGNVIEPRMMGKGLGLSTFIVFFGLIFWGFVLGYVGMFLSVPIMMVIKIVLENNPKTKWVAALLATKHEAELTLDEPVT